MQKAHSDARKTVLFSNRVLPDSIEAHAEARLDHLEKYYLILQISRQTLLQDTFDQLWHRRTGELLLPLRVRLGELDQHEIGHDLGGVQIEFFNDLCKELFTMQNRESWTTIGPGCQNVADNG